MFAFVPSAAFLFLGFYAIPVASKERHYFIGIDAVQWDYYPPTGNYNQSSNVNLCSGLPFEKSQLQYVGNEEIADNTVYKPRSIYKKLIFREYTNEKFSQIKPREDSEKHLGVLGPILRISEGETLFVTIRGLRVNESRNWETNVFGFEVDGLFPVNRTPEIKPGEIHTLKYYVQKASSPSNDSYVASNLLLYRGTMGNRGEGLDASSGIYRGLIGGCIVYRAGELLDSGSPRYVSTELITVFWVENENKNEDAKSQEYESNLLSNINGQIFCSLPGLKLTEGERARWYFGAVGDKGDVHTAHIHGTVLTTSGGEQTDSIRLIPGTTASTEVIPDNVGTWLVHCHVDGHLHNGMAAKVRVEQSEHIAKRYRSSKIVDNGSLRERNYYIQAEDVYWNYSPKGFNLCENRSFSEDEKVFVEKGRPLQLEKNIHGYTVGSNFLKSRYIEYTDSTFTKRKERDSSEEHLGVMGPVLRARIGDVLVIHFRNGGKDPKSMHPHGLFYNKSNEGALYEDGTSGLQKADDSVSQGETYVYRWVVPERSGPGPGEQTGSKLWIYHSHRNEIADSNSGLFGVILIVANEGYDEKTLRPINGTPEIFLHMSIINEAKSYFFEYNVNSVIDNNGKFKKLSKNEKFLKSMRKHSINGYLFCNGPAPQIPLDKASHFYFSSLGSVKDFHSPSVGDEILQLGVKSNRGSATLIAGSFTSSVVIPRRAGSFKAHCGVDMHRRAGMVFQYHVIGDPYREKIEPSITYFIAADKITWDYAIYGMDRCKNELFEHHGRMFTETSSFSPGSRYVKAVYREYTDESFQWRKDLMDLDMSFSGIAGPLMHFEVGDTVRIIFKNNLEFGVNLDLVGLDLLDGPRGSVEPGEITSYVYAVQEEQGPGENDPGPVARVYYSSVSPITHTAAGLVGVYAVVRKGSLRNDSRRPKGYKYTYPLLLNIFKEYESPFMKESLERFALNGTIDALNILRNNKMLKHKNTMHSANGYLFCNNPLLSIPTGTRAIFYVFGFGSEMSIHNPVWKGQVIDSITKRGANSDGVQILPYIAEAVIVDFEAKGTWPIACSVAHHVEAGMMLRIRISN